MKFNSSNIEVTPNCTCSVCMLAKKVNTMRTLKDLLDCRDEYKNLSKSTHSVRMNYIKLIINTALDKIKL